MREVFDLVIHEGYGTLRAANFLNAKYPNPDKIWTAQTVRSMIRNLMYTGRFHMNETLSEPNEALRSSPTKQRSSPSMRSVNGFPASIRSCGM